MTTFRERLTPGPWIYLAAALVIPASLLILAPLSLLAGIITAAVLYSGCVLLLFFGSPVIALTGQTLTAGSASIPVSALGDVTVSRGQDALDEMRTKLDARAWLVIRGWVKPVVRITVTDERDPAPYWLLSSRRPDELAAAIGSARATPASA